ncbi:HD-GYP domain-containing protein (c-di-GMP phosphodiesterase class II) [Paenibacillus forsythiae]|uniref:HD-GYP domain-containing protein (C-di-GMP phosphodiesterase class II) n=1 Tax=Paenibacillus forsythiae TaxID=365616 RepID=A0ABU3H2S5_9BACL|nr:HD-GYP domain-containing protein [Paenibacillus forsythiae]MDT3425124.1 HD-GYP domain-containing protein (c-di-GMP phosphodiesterase class II) [Paenibacillus forsythiae]
MKVHITDLKPGDYLKEDTFSHRGIHILSKGSQLQEDDINRLIQHGVEYVDIEGPVQFSASNPSVIQTVATQFDQTIEGFESLYMEALAKGSFNQSMVDDILKPLLSSLDQSKDVVTLLLLLDRDDDYTYNHSLQVGMLTYYIAAWLGYSKKECYDISRAGYLLDIGKCRIPASILKKPGKLTPEEFQEVQRHTTYGYEIIRNSMSDHSTALVALQHHEREDGSGYPAKLVKAEIHPYAQIAAIADVYSAMTTSRVYQSKQELLSVLRELHNLGFGKLNGKSVQAFIQHLMPNFIGKRVLLSTGDMGVIILNNSTDVFRPLVQSEGRFIDLSRERNLAIVEIYMD